MPNLFSIPLELREKIYRNVLHGPLRSKASTRPRKRISKDARAAQNTTADKDTTIDTVIHTPDLASPPPNSETASPTVPTPTPPSSSSTPRSTPLESEPDPDTEAGYYSDDSTIRYPPAPPLPPTHSLLLTSRQARAELQAVVRRSPLTYRVRLAYRDDKDILYPTWLSVPAISNHVDVLDVEIRIRSGRTASLFSAASNGDDGEGEEREAGDVSFGGLVLLRRFLERGVFFISRKRERGISVGLLVLRITPKDVQHREAREVFEETVETVQDLLVGRVEREWRWEAAGRREDEMVRFFAGRIGTFALLVGEERKEWDMKEVVAERDSIHREIDELREREREEFD